MIVTDRKNIAEQARLLRNLAFSRERRFLHHYIGFNYRMTNIQAAIGVAQMAKIDRFVEKKRHIAHRYNSLLQNVRGITLPPEKPWAKNVYWMYSILIEDNFGMTRDEVMTHLTKKGIETRTFFIPMNQQPVFYKMGLFKKEKCPVAEELSRKGLYLPSGVSLTDEQIEYVCQALKEKARR
jgi:perosamine synthetase